MYPNYPYFAVAITRTCGSGGGSYIGKQLAKAFDIDLYDRKLLRLASEDSGISEELFAHADENTRKTMLYRVSERVYDGSIIPPESGNFISDENLFNYQAKVLRELLNEESYICVGRAADFVLRDKPNVLTVYVDAPYDWRVEREMKRQGIGSSQAKHYIDKLDRYRESYYKYHTGRQWKRVENYDLCLDSAAIGLDNCVELIKKVIELPQKLGNTSHVTGIVLTVDHLTKELIGIFRHVAELLGLSQETFAVIDDKESFYAFAMNQEKSLWMHDVFLFSCGKNAVSSYDLLRDMHTKPQMITIHATGAQELGEEKDEAFARLLTNCFANRSVSSVYLVGDGFDGEWMKQSLAVLCRGRRAFLGQNLFSKGACYMARIREMGENWPFIYMGENEMKFNLSLSVVEKEKKKVLNLVSAGKNWFEIKNTCEVILSGTPQVEFLKQLPSSSTPQIQTVELEDLPVRPDRTTRLRITASPVANDKIEVEIRDLGFGEFFPATGRAWKSIIMMG